MITKLPERERLRLVCRWIQKSKRRNFGMDGPQVKIVLKFEAVA